MSGHYLNEEATHRCDLPYTGRCEDREFHANRLPVGRKWQCDECGRVWVVMSGRQDINESHEFWRHWHEEGTPVPQKAPVEKRKKCRMKYAEDW